MKFDYQIATTFRVLALINLVRSSLNKKIGERLSFHEQYDWFSLTDKRSPGRAMKSGTKNMINQNNINHL
ncbi:hypothetical protein V2J95_16150 [Pseudomonas alliivorans]|nr:hypothetical protein [Pseudomonas alliivorans]MEE5116326.1 hypothetical protein [Pseudomonas alliivorans]